MKRSDLALMAEVALDLARWTALVAIVVCVWWLLDTAFVQTIDHLQASLTINP